MSEKGRNVRCRVLSLDVVGFLFQPAIKGSVEGPCRRQRSKFRRRRRRLAVIKRIIKSPKQQKGNDDDDDIYPHVYECVPTAPYNRKHVISNVFKEFVVQCLCTSPTRKKLAVFFNKFKLFFLLLSPRTKIPEIFIVHYLISELTRRASN